MRYQPEPLPPHEAPGLSENLERELARVASAIDDLREDVLRTFTFAAYGGMHQPAKVPLPDITATWQTLPFSVLSIATPRFVTIDLAQNALALELPGVYRFSLMAEIAHDDVNRGREVSLRAWNITAGAPMGLTYDAYIGRNQPGSNIAMSDLNEIGTGELNNLVRFEISCPADVLTLVEFKGGVSLNGAGEFLAGF